MSDDTHPTTPKSSSSVDPPAHGSAGDASEISLSPTIAAPDGAMPFVDPRASAPTLDSRASAPTMAVTGEPPARGPAGPSGFSREASIPEEVLRSSAELFANIPTEYPGRYEFKKEIGVGGMGRVNLTYDTHIGRDVAIKQLLPRFVSGDGHSGTTSLPSPTEVRFLNEARITGYLEHPGIVPVYELAQTTRGEMYYAMQYVQGTTLGSRIHGRPLIDRLELLPNFLDVCNAIAYAHSRGVVHRDLKPENIMLGQFGETIVLDWGLAKKNDTTDVARGELAKAIVKLKGQLELGTTTGTPIGTPQYMPPEQARGTVDKVDERSDVYTLGAILYEMLTDHPPHTGKNAFDMILSVIEKEVVPPLEIDPQIPPELSAIALKALSKAPGDRYQSAGDLADDIRRWQRGGLVRSYDYTLTERLLRWIRRHKKSLVVGAVIGITFITALVVGSHMESRRSIRRERQRQERVLAQVKGIIHTVELATPKSLNWFDTYLLKLISLKEDVTERHLLTLLDHPRLEVRKLAIRALGGMKSARAVRPLMDRLLKGREPSEGMKIEIIKSLGIIGDPAANGVVQKVRWEHGQNSPLWTNTEVAYSMIPVPRLDSLDGLTFEELHLRGKALYNKGHRRQAIGVFEAAIQKNPKDFRPHNMLGIIYADLEENEKAIACYTRALELSPKNAHFAYNNRGLIYRRVERFDLAIQDFNRALSMKEWSTAYSNRGVVYRYLGQSEKAVADYTRAMALKPKSRKYPYNLAMLYYQSGDLDRAGLWVKKALALGPDSINSNLLQVNIHLAHRRYDEAEQLLQRLYEKQSLNIDVSHAYLVLHEVRGETGKLPQWVRPLTQMRRPSRHVSKILSLGHFLVGDYQKGLDAALDQLAKKDLNTKVKLYTLIRVIPHLVKLGQTGRFARLAAPLVDPQKPQWIDSLTLYLLGKKSADDLKPQLFTRMREFEFAFYQGMRALMQGRADEAKAHLTSAVASPFFDKVEWLYAYRLLNRNL